MISNIAAQPALAKRRSIEFSSGKRKPDRVDNFQILREQKPETSTLTKSFFHFFHFRLDFLKIYLKSFVFYYLCSSCVLRKERESCLIQLQRLFNLTLKMFKTLLSISFESCSKTIQVSGKKDRIQYLKID